MEKIEKKHVLHVIYNLHRGGTEKYLINVLQYTYNQYENIVVYFDGENEWEDQLKKMNVKTIKIDSKKISRIKSLIRLMKKERIDIVYAYSYLDSMFTVLASFIAGVKKRIVHSHRQEAGVKKGVLKRFLPRIIISALATDRLACNYASGKSLFLQKKFTIINNGIDLNKYRFNSEKRRKIRSELGITLNEKVILAIGRIDENKNQLFLAKIAKEIDSKCAKYKLVIVGNGQYEYKNRIVMFLKQNRLEDKVLLINNVDNIEDYYCAADLFVIPSKKEGFPYVLIEAQANGLKCFVSECMDDSCFVTNNVSFLPLEKGEKYWADCIMATSLKRNNVQDELKKNGFDVKDSVARIVNIYEGIKNGN